MILRTIMPYSPPADTVWHRKFLWLPTIVQTVEDFHRCKSGSAVVWLEWVWRQNISATQRKIYRYVLSKETPR